MLRQTLLSILPFLIGSLSAKDTFTPYTENTIPRSVTALWKDIDPRAEPLDIQVIKEWIEDGVTTRYLIYTVCTHGGQPCRVAAFYSFPTGAKKVPAFVWAHGGGQRAERKRGTYFAKRGYATIDFNWGGREMVEGIKLNTDWGKLDPSQGPRFYPGALRPNVKLNHQPDAHTIDPVVSPRNGNWFLLALAGRRAITLLERQPEVDAQRIGFTGYSMGGNITSYCAIDPRLKAVAPMVGGTGHLTVNFPGLPGTSRKSQYRNPEQFAATMDSAAYWLLVQCPVLFLNATNDFHGIFDWSYRCIDSLPHDQWRASYALHYNHSLRSEQYAALNVFFDRHLKGTGKGLPIPASARLSTKVDQKTAILETIPDPKRAGELVRVEVLYSHDPNPRARHWITARLSGPAPAFVTKLPLRSGLPLLAFANLTYRLPVPENTLEDNNSPAAFYTVTSKLASIIPDQIAAQNLREKASAQTVFHDFTTQGDAGWGSSSGRRGLRTYRFQDPARATPKPSNALVLRLKEAQSDPLSIRVRISRNEWLTPGVRASSSIAIKQLAPGETAIRFTPGDFQVQGQQKTPAPDKDWENITYLQLEIVEPKKHGRPIDLTRPASRTFLRDMIWE